MDRRIINIALTVLLCASSAWGRMGIMVVGGQSQAGAAGLTVSDNFNRADGALGSNWTQITGTVMSVILSNAAVGSGSIRSYAVWTANTLDADQCVQATILGAGTTGDTRGLLTRHLTTSASGYQFVVDGGSTTSIKRNDAGTLNTLVTDTVAFASGDVMKVCAIGSTITGYKNGTQVLQTTDSTYSTGQTGIFFYDDNTVVQLDDWSAWEN